MMMMNNQRNMMMQQQNQGGYNVEEQHVSESLAYEMKGSFNRQLLLVYAI
jgi:hypothetical protein